MKRYYAFVIVTILFIAFYSCENKNGEVNSKPKIKLQGLTLNNNKKWIANKETHIGMMRIDSILKSNTLLNGKVLGNALSKETSYIIKSCNMKGTAHDQLHIVLVPLLEEITQIKETESIDKLKQKTTHLKHLVAIYFRYFKT
ncbi:hypothetical protein [uncultured Winogradskyella sp.]|uniref:hypothetical protein n=1 Tax=uncultured Winogradskyella sp. TaxID=395353 RepID=UPI00260F9190|nr:hypothetical protein [uncultured Winogradskyella sp.]